MICFEMIMLYQNQNIFRRKAQFFFIRDVKKFLFVFMERLSPQFQSYLFGSDYGYTWL